MRTVWPDRIDRMKLLRGLCLHGLLALSLHAAAATPARADVSYAGVLPCADCAGIDYLPIDTNEAFTTVIAGLEFYVIPALRFSPNVEWVNYSKPSGSALKPKSDLATRMTFFVSW